MKGIIKMKKDLIKFEDFLKLDIRVGTIISASEFPEAKKAAYKLMIDFGYDIGLKKSSAQITDKYTLEELIGKRILAVVNFSPRQIANYLSEVLVLGVYTDGGVSLITVDKDANNGDILG